MDLNDAFYKSLLDNLYDGIYFVDRQRKITYWNKGAERISGFCAEEVQENYCWNNILRHINDQGVALCYGICPLAATILDGQAREASVYLHHKEGHRVPVLVRTAPLYDAHRHIIGAIEIFSDNTAQSMITQRVNELERLALLDPLTQLANRRYIEMNLHSRLEELRRYRWPFGVLFLDVDHFKLINDTYGHTMGDEILRMLARTFTANMRTSDIFGRWGGEEFVAIVRNVDHEHLYNLAERLRILIAESYLIEKLSVIHVTISIGGTLARADDTVESLLQRVDQLMYQSKTAGRNRVIIAAS